LQGFEQKLGEMTKLIMRIGCLMVMLALAMVTLMFCVAWPRPLLVGPILVILSVLIEGLQALTPDRSSNVMAALYGALGALIAALLTCLRTPSDSEHLYRLIPSSRSE
jgi:VanZ family protein